MERAKYTGIQLEIERTLICSRSLEVLEFESARLTRKRYSRNFIET